MNKTKHLLLITLSAFIFSCAHHKDVRPGGTNGEHTVIIKSKSQQEGMRNALAQASHFCKQQNKVPKITNEGKAYQGDLDEDVYKQSKKIQDAASIFLGGTAEGQKVNQAADSYLGAPYSTEVKFTCQ